MLNTWFAKIREVPLIEVISRLGFTISHNGKNKIRSRCILPNHCGNNKSGRALCIDTSQNVWYCHGCGVGGGNVEIVKHLKGLSAIEAANTIAQLSHLETFDELQASPEERERFRCRAEEQATVRDIHTIAAYHFHASLTLELRNTLRIPQGTFHPTDTWMNLYETWGLTDKVVDENLIGYDNSTLLETLREKGYSDSAILKSGLFYMKDNGTIGDSVFKNRLVFPYLEMGQVTNFIARSTCRTWPCYMEDPSTVLKETSLPYAKYKKLPRHTEDRAYISPTIQSQLFGLSELRSKTHNIMVEGITDVILMRTFFAEMLESGIQDAAQWGVGSFLSNQVGNDHLKQLAIAARDKDILMFLCDSEISARGNQGAYNTAKKLLEENILPLIGTLPLDGKQKVDPAQWVRDKRDLIKADPQKTWQEYLQIVEQAKNPIEIALDKATKRLEEKQSASLSYRNKIKKGWINEIMSLITRLPELQQEDYLEALTRPPFNCKLSKINRLMKSSLALQREKPQEQEQEFLLPGIVPEGWELNSRGLYREVITQSRETRYIKIAQAPMVISEKHYDIDTGEYYLKAGFYELGEWKTRTESRDMFMSSRLLPKLAKWGFPTNTENSKHLVNFLTEYEAANRDTIKISQVVSSCGNKSIRGERAFVLGRRCIYKDREEKIEFLTPDAGDLQIVNAFEAAGDFTAWIEMLKKCVAYDGVMLAIYVAFCAPLLRYLKSKGFTLHLWGRSSIGKTITLIISSSIWGDPSRLIQSWNQREVATERRMAACNEVGIFLDELKQAIRKDDVERTLYAVTNGHGRGRGSLKGQQRTLFWLLTLISTGEMPATHAATDEGGQARVINLRDHLFGTGNRELVRELELTAKRNYGLAGPYFLQHAEVQRIQENYDRHLEEISRQAKSDIAYRIGNNLAVILAVGDEVCRVFGLTEPSLASLTGELLQEASTIDRATVALTQVTEWALANEGLFYPHADQKKDVAGVWKEEAYLAFFPYKLRDILEKFGFNYDAVLRDWAERGWIKCQKGKRTYPVGVNNRTSKMVVVKWDVINPE